MRNTLTILALLGFASISHAASITKTGKIAMLEVWETGNIAFTISASNGNNLVTECNSQFILNESSKGTKNMYSLLLASKIAKTDVKVVYSDTCGAAENYNSTSTYNIPKYIYPQ